jgi:RAT1-interacting protein
MFCSAGLKQVVQGDGVWRIRKLEKSHVIEVFKIEESGHGDILSSGFKVWRESMAGS